MKMALDFHNILDKYKIWYVGIGGTLLGAVRHHGNCIYSSIIYL
jgi:phosphorylcholine metabolism protein LicD